MALVQFGSYLSQNFVSGVTTANLTGGATVEGFASDNSSEFSFLFRQEDGTASSPKIVAMTEEGIEAVVGHDTANLYGLVVALTGGGFATVVGCGGSDIFARVFDAQGNAVSDYIRVSDSTGDRYLTGATATADGGFTVNWSDNSNAGDVIEYGGGDPIDHREYDNWARHYSSTGASAGDAFLAQGSDGVNLAKDQRNGDCVGLTNGDTAFAFSDVHRLWNDAHSAYGYNTSITLSINGAEIKVNDDFDSQTSNPVPFGGPGPKVTQLSNGNIAVAWLENPSDAETWHARIFKANGTAVTNDTTLFSFAGFTDGTFALTAMDNGKFALLCTVHDADGTAGVRLGVFDSHGALLDQSVVSDASGHQTVSDLTNLGDGALMATYRNQNDPSFATRTDIIVQPGSGQIVTTGNSSAEVLAGGSKNDWLDGKGGNDTESGNGGNDHLFGNGGDDNLYGGNGNDDLFGAGGRDRLEGGAGDNLLEGGGGADKLFLTGLIDTVVYGDVSDSMRRNCDTVTGFDFTQDKFDLPFAITDVDTAVTSGSLTKRGFDDKLAAALDDAHLAANHAVIFQPDQGSLAGNTYLIIDANGVAGYQGGQDMVIQLDGATNLASIDATDFI